jgi:hypothetical protein
MMGYGYIRGEASDLQNPKAKLITATVDAIARCYDIKDNENVQVQVIKVRIFRIFAFFRFFVFRAVLTRSEGVHHCCGQSFVRSAWRQSDDGGSHDLQHQLDQPKQSDAKDIQGQSDADAEYHFPANGDFNQSRTTIEP